MELSIPKSIEKNSHEVEMIMSLEERLRALENHLGVRIEQNYKKWNVVDSKSFTTGGVSNLTGGSVK